MSKKTKIEKIKSLPARVFIRWEQDGDTSYLVVEEDVDCHAEVNQQRRIGIYGLESVRTLTCKPDLIK